MEMTQPSLLRMPAFLHGPFPSVERKTLKEGRRHAEQYQKDGSFIVPRELVAVPPGEVVVAHEVVDFDRARPAWRLYMLSKVMSGLCEALDWQNAFQVRDTYEAAIRQTAWGALYFVVSRDAPKSAERTALRLQALLRFWEPLLSARYRFSSPDVSMSLEQLVSAAIDWAMDAWCPVGESSVRARLETAADRMAHATKEDCIAAILRQMPRALTSARDLQHRPILSEPAFLRERLAMLDPSAFERVSGACTSDLLFQLYAWDRQLEKQ
jgi:hypothetical protein